MKQVSCDICIVGAGSGGLALASIAARLGRKVVLVERAEMGGDCLNYGCVPSKALLAAARRAEAVREASRFGIEAGTPSVDFGRVMAHVKGAIAAIAPHDSEERYAAMGCTVIRAAARFTGAATLVAGDVEVAARRFAIATGSSPSVPALPGLDRVPFLNNETLLRLDRLPRHLAILGAGPEGMEMAQGFRRLGSEVTLIEAGRPLGASDAELSAVVLSRLAREGVDVVVNATVEGVEERDGGIALGLAAAGSRRSIAASHLLVATGRRPNVEGLDLDRAGVAWSRDGVAVTPGLRTTNRRIYALGDVVAGGMRFTHVAAHQAGLVARSAFFRLPARLETQAIPRVVYTDPELAEVGLGEAEAQKRRVGYRVLKWYFKDSDRALADGDPEGLAKVVVDRRGRVLGAGIVGRGAGEMILPWVDMVARRRNIAAMARFVAPYPTLSEAGPRIAFANFAALASRRWVHRVLDVLAAFG